MIELLEGRFFKTFIAVAEEKSFSRAAEKLGYVQSTVTTHIKLLEQACGQQLFHRLSRGVKPTEAGLKLSKFAYQFVQLGLSVEEAMHETNEPQGTVRLSMHESFFVTRMSPPVQQFKLNFPKVKFRVEPGFDHQIIEQVLQHAVDFGFLPRNPQRNDLHFYPLIQEELVFIASNTLTEKFESKGMSILNEETVLSFGNSCLYHTHAHQFLRKAGIEGSNAIEIPSIEMLKQAVKCGMGFALVPAIAAKKELENGEFRALPLRLGIFSSHGLVVNKDRELSLPAALFKSHLLEYFSNLSSLPLQFPAAVLV